LEAHNIIGGSGGVGHIAVSSPRRYDHYRDKKKAYENQIHGAS